MHFHQLDITDIRSIKRLHNFMKKKYRGIDVLVNNAGIALKNDVKFRSYFNMTSNITKPLHEIAEVRF